MLFGYRAKVSVTVGVRCHEPVFSRFMIRLASISTSVADCALQREFDVYYRKSGSTYAPRLIEIDRIGPKQDVRRACSLAY
jgi:hypothetical protein